MQEFNAALQPFTWLMDWRGMADIKPPAIDPSHPTTMHEFISSGIKEFSVQLAQRAAAHRDSSSTDEAAWAAFVVALGAAMKLAVASEGGMRGGEVILPPLMECWPALRGAGLSPTTDEVRAYLTAGSRRVNVV